ncbi:MAG: CvpA family protein [Corallococcus sp.]|nr:CvpA family protein [Corallococcus sp.]
MFNWVDYVIFGSAVIGLIVGIFKGFLKQLFDLAGIFVVSIGTAYLYKYPTEWLASVIESEGTRQIVALIATFVVLVIVYKLITMLIMRAFDKVKLFKALDRILGLVIGVGIVYVLFAVIVSLVLNTPEGFIQPVKDFLQEPLQNSWCVKNLYSNNVIGDWIVNMITTQVPATPAE